MKIGILGAGTWGIAIARMLSNNGNDVTVWSAVSSEIDELNSTRICKKLDCLTIPQNIIFTKNLNDATIDSEIIVIAVPSIFVRSVATQLKGAVKDSSIIVNLSKGIEPGTYYMMTEVIADAMELDDNKKTKIVALSGPTHAEEVAKDMPTTIVSACEDKQTAEKIQNIFSNACMRVYTNTDIKGVELCGALKNVMALAAGMSDGLGFGDNAKAAIITRGITEIARLGRAMKCDYKTFYGLSGVGDLIVTATSRHSRNNKAGYLIGTGCTAKEATERVGMVVEGLNALEAAVGLAEKYNVEMPIVSAVNEVVNGSKKPYLVVRELMARDFKNE